MAYIKAKDEDITDEDDKTETLLLCDLKIKQTSDETPRCAASLKT